MIRRTFLAGLVGLVAAPTIVRASGIMPVRSWSPTADWLEHMLTTGQIVPPGEYRAERGLRLLSGGGGFMCDAILRFPAGVTGLTVGGSVRDITLYKTVILVPDGGTAMQFLSQGAPPPA